MVQTADGAKYPLKLEEVAKQASISASRRGVDIYIVCNQELLPFAERLSERISSINPQLKVEIGHNFPPCYQKNAFYRIELDKKNFTD